MLIHVNERENNLYFVAMVIPVGMIILIGYGGFYKYWKYIKKYYEDHPEK